VVFTSGHTVVTAQHFTIVNVNAQHKKKLQYNSNDIFQKYTYKQKNKWWCSSGNGHTHVMSTLVLLSEALNLCRNMSVSTGGGSLNGYDSLYSISVGNVVLMVPTLVQKSTNMQIKQSHNPVGQQ